MAERVLFFRRSATFTFQKFNNKHFEYALQLKLLYDWNNIRPFAGFLINKNNYKMQFLVPEDKVLSKLDDFKSDQLNFGFSLGVQYLLIKNFFLSGISGI
jgi:long-subunit fatty acid transport protein